MRSGDGHGDERRFLERWLEYQQVERDAGLEELGISIYISIRGALLTVLCK